MEAQHLRVAVFEAADSDVLEGRLDAKREAFGRAIAWYPRGGGNSGFWGEAGFIGGGANVEEFTLGERCIAWQPGEEGRGIVRGVLDLEDGLSLRGPNHAEDPDDERPVHFHIPDEEGAELEERVKRDANGGEQVEDATIQALGGRAMTKLGSLTFV